MKEDRDLQDTAIARFLNGDGAMVPAGVKETGQCTESQNHLFAAAMTLEKYKKYKWIGREMYNDPCFADFRRIGRHYDLMGSLVRLDFVDFDLLFALVPFPDKFWDSSEPYRRAMAENWGGEDVPLPDFWQGLTDLHDRYERERALGRRNPSAAEATTLQLLESILHRSPQSADGGDATDRAGVQQPSRGGTRSGPNLREGGKHMEG